jgi:hypothetical protein
MWPVMGQEESNQMDGLVIGVGSAYGNDGHEVDDHVDGRLCHAVFISR